MGLQFQCIRRTRGSKECYEAVARMITFISMHTRLQQNIYLMSNLYILCNYLNPFNSLKRQCNVWCLEPSNSNPFCNLQTTVYLLQLFLLSWVELFLPLK